MESGSVTTAAIISFTEKLEDDTSAFYEALAERWPDAKDAFLTFAQDGKKNKVQVIRTYQETISDALEASYSFEGFDLTDYALRTDLAGDADYAGSLAQALELEERAIAFYQDVAERSESLLATIPRAFKRVAKKRGKRREQLEAMLSDA
jgi:hypothetical protein